MGVSAAADVPAAAASTARGPAALRGSVPAALAAPAAIGVVFLLLPLAGLVVKAPWPRLAPLLTSTAALDALRLSLTSALAATALSLVLGVPLAWVLARTAFPCQRLVRALVTLPLVLPPVVGGIALLLAYGRRGLVGAPLQAVVGISIPFTPTAVVLAETFVAMPFLVVTVEGALRSSNLGLEEAAATLGAGRLYVLRRVTLPLVAPSLAAGAVLCFARALGEFGATLTFAGSLPGRTQTLPLLVYQDLAAGDSDAAIALSLVLLAVSVTVLLSLRDRWWGSSR
ncbi:MAG: ABC transporter permease [Actinomycetales bacterium]